MFLYSNLLCIEVPVENKIKAPLALSFRSSFSPSLVEITEQIFLSVTNGKEYRGV